MADDAAEEVGQDRSQGGPARSVRDLPACQLAELAIRRQLFAEILRLIDGLWPKAALT